MGDVLSQSEIDNLLNALSSGELDVDEIKENSEQTVKDYDFARPSKFSKEHLRTLEIIFEHYGRLLTTNLPVYLRKSVQVEVMNSEAVTYSEFTNALSNPVLLGIVNFAPLQGNIIVEMASGLGYAIVDRMLGGRGDSLDKTREFSEIELLIIERILVICINLLQEPWQNVLDISPHLERIETNSQYAQIISPSEVIAIITMNIKIGDVVFVKKGNNGILGKGIVESDYEYDADRADEYSNIRKVNWTNKGNWTINHQAPQKTLTDITPYSDFVQEIKDLFEDDDMVDDEQEVTYPEYTAENFLDDVYMSEEDYSRLVGLLRNKKNIILQGAPGVGKTYAAKRLAYSMMGVKDIERVMMVQFHQSYSYEDFIMGFRPSSTGFELKKGAFYNFCKKAEIDSDNEYFFIIDEINRGNLSKIFGELFMLIENDKRGNALQLLYFDEKFAVPENVYIIGMMNTADRSLAMLDYAFRRRFAFFDIKPGFETPGFREYRMALDNEKFNKLISCVESLNREISVDESLGEGFCIGHSYFCNLQPDTIDDSWLYGVVEYELIPLLKEYWFDELMKVKDWSENLRSTIK